MHQVSVPSTTHTVELTQLTELNDRLKGQNGPGISAAEIGLEGAKLISPGIDGGLSGSAVLTQVCWEGPPEFPYIHGHFVMTDEPAALIVELHTTALKELGRRLGVRQRWGP